MEPTGDNLSAGGHSSHSGDYYGCPAGTFDQQEQDEDLMPWVLSLFSDFQSPPPSSSLPPAEGFAGPENFGDGWQISPLDEHEMPCIPAAIAQETNYAAAPASLVATLGTEAGQLWSNFSPSSTTLDDDLLLPFSEEDIQQMMTSWEEPLLHPPMVFDELSNIPTDAVQTVLQQGTTSTTADELPNPLQQLPLPTNDPEAQPAGGGWAWLDLSLDDEVQIQQMTPTILPSQPPPSPTPVINPGPDEANHAASAPMGSQGTLMLRAPQDQEDDILSRARTRGRRATKSRAPSSQLQVGSYNLFAMGVDMMRQLGREIGIMLKDEKHGSKVWRHFWRSQCKYCRTLNGICLYCYTVMRNPSTIELSRHNNIHTSGASSKETQRSSHQALQIKEIAENPNGESEPIETDNSNCATAAQVDTQGTNAVVMSPWQQHQLPMDLEEQMATILSSQPCCEGPEHSRRLVDDIDELHKWWDLFIRLSDGSSYCSSTTKSSAHDGFRLKFSDGKYTGSKMVHVHSSPAWVHVSENPPCGCPAGVLLLPRCDTIGSSWVFAFVQVYYCNWKSMRACAYPWQYMHFILSSLGFEQEFAARLVIYAFGWVNECNLRLRSPCSSNNKRVRIVELEQGDASSGKRKRESARSWVWNHFTKMEAQGSNTKAKCKYCTSELQADSKKHGTRSLAGHIIKKHPDKLAESPL